MSLLLVPILMSYCLDIVAVSIPSSYQVVYTSYTRSRHTDFNGGDRKKRALHKTDEIFLNITGDSLHFNLKLQANTRLLAPGFQIYLRNHDNVTQTMNTSLGNGELIDRNCFYTGNITSHSDSNAAISLCQGVTGVLRLPGEDYVIEPLPGHLIINKQTNNQQPHIIYKTTSLPHQEFRQQPTQYYRPYKDYSETLHNSYTSSYNTRELKQRHTGHKSTSLHITVETLIVADKSLILKHGRHNITTYILSIFNIVSKLFEDNTLGKPVEILLVGLVLLEDEEPGLHITNHADYTLNNFCQWQSTLSDSTGRRHDHAVLLTGLDICSYKNSPCDTLGFAPINGMCNPLRSCIMSEDSGLATAFTITHEIGHNFGMFHDGEDNKCKGSGGNIMSPTLTGKNGLFQWSSCSRNYFLRFLNTIQSTCLSDKPKYVTEFKFPDKLPGELYDASTQCKWLFGNDAKSCLYDFGDNKMCKSLWCYRSNHMCETKYLPAAEGTTCGVGMWCRQGKCIFKAPTHKVVKGGWSPWTSWTTCSRTCGGGIQQRTRKCNNPKPQYNGKSCVGDMLMYRLCNQKGCPKNTDYRQDQCEEYNRKLFRGWYYKWKKYQKIPRVDDQCKLYCQAEDYNFFFALNNKVKDGTLCNDYSNMRCIQGSCKDYGCDLIIDSTMKSDACGVCKGNNSTCNFIKGTFNEQVRLNTYQYIVTLPMGARNIDVTEIKSSPNYLSLRNKHGKYSLNGNLQISNTGSYKIGGTLFIYNNIDQLEQLKSDGPLEDDIILELLSRGANYGIQYTYTLDKSLARNVYTQYQYYYKWDVKLSQCSHTCAGGTQNVTLQCIRSDNTEVSLINCDLQSKPSTTPHECSLSPCPSRWEVSPWEKCSRSCGGGKQKRKIRCWQKMSATKDRKIKPRFCKHLPKESKKRYCNKQDCAPKWSAEKWSKCSANCGQGYKTRQVICKKKTTSGLVDLPESSCNKMPTPTKHKYCFHRGSCLLRLHDRRTYQWLISSWEKCSATCDKGFRRRSFRCSYSTRGGRYKQVSKRYCSHIPKPSKSLVEDCLLPPCIKLSWKTAPWTECSVTCGDGFMYRTVRCVNDQNIKSEGCHIPKPEHRKSCQKSLCFSSSQSQTSCKDQFDWCPLVPIHKICSHSYYGSKCCQSCKGKS